MYGKRINTINLCADGLMEALIQGVIGTGHEVPLTVEEADERLGKHVKSFADTGAFDVMLLNVNYHVSLIPSKVWDTAWQRLDGTSVTYEQLDSFHHWNKHYVLAHERGIEPYGITIKHCRKNGLSPWFSVRMNEFHYLRWPETSATLWVEHPEYRVGEPDSQFDYRFPEVRQYYIDYVAELCENWDIDGIELDMIRRFPNDAGEEERAAVTDCVRKIRARINEISQKKQHEIKLSARVYSLLESSKLGWCDAAAWVREGLVDGLTLANFNMPCDYDIPFDQWRKEIGFEEGYFLQAGSDGGNLCAHYKNPYARAIWLDTEMMKGFAESGWANGADGIYVFNINFPDRLDFSCLQSRASSCAGARRHLVPIHDPNGHVLEMMLDDEWQRIQINVGRGGEKGYVRLGVCDEPGEICVKVNGIEARNLGVIDPKPGKEYVTDPRYFYGFTEVTQAAPYVLEYDCGYAMPAGMAKVEIRSNQSNQMIWAEMRIIES